MNDFSFFLPISKVETQADGSRLVSGYASTPTKDLDGEIVSLDAIKSALPAYWEWRNVRQMHAPLAVGRAQEATVDSDGLFLTAKIVEENCIKLIDEKVLQGFSIGGKKLAKKGDTITELELIEISVVDRPANPDCRFVALGKSANVGVALVARETPADGDLVISAAEAGPLRKFFGRLFGKREFSDKERSQLADSGVAMPDGSFPIKNEEDLRNAIQAHGRAKNPEAAKKHIVERAHALGAASLLPAEWERHEPTEAEKAAAAHQQSDPAAVTGGTPAIDDRPPFDQLKEHLEMANLDEIFARIAGRAAGATGVEKRFSKASFGKAAHHLGKMMECAKSAQGHFGKAAGCMMEHVKAQKSADPATLKKAADGDHVTAAMGHMAAGNAKMEEAQDHGDLAQHYMGKAAGGDEDGISGGASGGGGEGFPVGGSSSGKGQGDLTEGGVPQYDATGAYPNKAAGGYTKEIVDQLIAATKAAGDAAAKAAAAEAKVEVMSKFPASNPRVARFADVGKAFAPGSGAGEQPSTVEALYKGVNLNPASPGQATDAAAQMIANMHANPGIFAKPVTDPSFRGTAGVRR